MARHSHWKRLLAGIVVGAVAAALTFNIESLARLSSIELFDMIQFFGRVLVVPGVLFSIAMSGKTNGFPLWLAALGNLAFWIVIFWLLGALLEALQERKRLASWQPLGRQLETPVAEPEIALPLSAGAVTALHDLCTREWHIRPGTANAPVGDEFLEMVERQHRANFDLWHIEDEARRPGATDSDLALVKRRVDATNQLRNDLSEELDRMLLAWLMEKGLPNRSAPLNSESPGLILDRLSILALKIYHTREETTRKEAPPGHAERNVERLDILEEQRNDLAGCLDALCKATLGGTRRFKLYRQMKMYNDPDLNPAIYGEGKNGGKS
jgi:hypothetical protein